MPIHPVDIIVLLLSVFYFIKGYQKGLIIEIATLIALFLGIIAAMEMAGVVSGILKDYLISAKWVFYAGYLVSFLLVFFGVQLLGKLLDRIFQATPLNFINRVLGGFSGLFKIVFVVSLIFWLLEQAEGLGSSFRQEVYSYQITAPIAPWAINKATSFLPILSDLIEEAEKFFSEINKKIQ